MPSKTRKAVMVIASTKAEAARRALRENPGWTIDHISSKKQYNVALKKKKTPGRRKK